MAERQSGTADLIAIYVLKCPDGVVRYVGKAKKPEARLRSHLWPHSRSRMPVSCWVRALRKKNLRPTMEVVEWVCDWEEAERRWIGKYRDQGADLLNVSDGGLDAKHLGRANGRYPAYRWVMMFCGRTGRRHLADDIRKTAGRIKDEGGSVGLRAYDDYLRRVVLDAAPLTNIPVSVHA